MPFINYDIGDWAVAAGPCGCGRGFPTLQALEGRTMELLRLPNGKVLATGAFSALLTLRYPVMSYVQEYQAVQESISRIVLRVVPTTRFSSDYAATLQDQLETFLGPDLSVVIEPVEQIGAEASGKRLIIKTSLPTAD
jgi:phenylacetate-CoA ligase